MKTYFYFRKKYSESRIKYSFIVNVEEGKDFMFNLSLSLVGINIDELDRNHYCVFSTDNGGITGILTDYDSFNLMRDRMFELGRRIKKKES